MMKKLFLTLGLGCLALSLQSAAMRQAASRFGVAARAGMCLQQPLSRALPQVTPVASQATRGIATLSQSHKSYGKSKARLIDFAPLIPLGAVAAMVSHEADKQENDREPIIDREPIEEHHVYTVRIKTLSEQVELEQKQENYESERRLLKSGRIHQFVAEDFTFMQQAIQEQREREENFKQEMIERTEKEENFEFAVSRVLLDNSFIFFQSEELISEKITTLVNDLIDVGDSYFPLADASNLYALIYAIQQIPTPYWFMSQIRSVVRAASEKLFDFLTIENQGAHSSFVVGLVNKGYALSIGERSYFACLYMDKFVNVVEVNILLDILLSIHVTMKEADRKRYGSIILERMYKENNNNNERYLVPLVTNLFPLLSADEASCWAHKFLDKIQEDKTIASSKKIELALTPYLAVSPSEKRESFEILLERPLPIEFLEHSEKGPLFSTKGHQYLANEGSNLLKSHPNFENLLPIIREYVADQYAQNKMVYFHGQNSGRKLASDVYEILYEIRTAAQLPENFIPLRSTDTSSLSDADTARLVKNGLVTFDGENDGTDDYGSLLFTNMHLFANVEGANTWSYAVRNFNQSRVYSSLDHQVAPVFKEQGFEKEFEFCKKDLEELEELYNAAIEEQGEHGRLIVISMPKQVASKISYFAKPGGLINTMLVDGKSTSDPVKVAEHFDRLTPTGNEYCICLTDEMLNPQKAQEAGIEMQSFDPAIYWETEKAQAYKAAVQRLKAKIQAMYQARKNK